MTSGTTLLRALVTERHLQRYDTFGFRGFGPVVTLPVEHRTELARVYVRNFVSALTPEQRRLRAAVELDEFLQSAFPNAPAY